MSAVLVILAALALGAWVALALAWGGFWRLREWLPRAAPRRSWPAVAVIIPARNEAATIHTVVEHVLGQDYTGKLHVVVVDDDSTDGTAAAAKAGAEVMGRGEQLSVIQGTPPPEGWTGKLWALEHGLRAVEQRGIPAAYVWLTDADISHSAHTLQRLVAQAEDDERALVSLMVRLTGEGFWPRVLLPAFVFFFRKLYPFAWVNDPDTATAAAAGGCVLVHKRALIAAGGFDAIRGSLIDDCALARLIHTHGGGRIWLGITKWSHSLRVVRGLGDVWAMVTRTAYAQLHRRPSWLLGTVAGMALLYLVPPLALLLWPWHASGAAAVFGGLAWALMALLFVPTLKLYDEHPRSAVLLPVAGVLYTLMTVDSARRHLLRRGGTWKGRVQGHTHTDGPASGV